MTGHTQSANPGNADEQEEKSAGPAQKPGVVVPAPVDEPGKSTRPEVAARPAPLPLFAPVNKASKSTRPNVTPDEVIGGPLAPGPTAGEPALGPVVKPEPPGPTPGPTPNIDPEPDHRRQLNIDPEPDHRPTAFHHTGDSFEVFDHLTGRWSNLPTPGPTPGPTPNIDPEPDHRRQLHLAQIRDDRQKSTDAQADKRPDPLTPIADVTKKEYTSWRQRISGFARSTWQRAKNWKNDIVERHRWKNHLARLARPDKDLNKENIRRAKEQRLRSANKDPDREWKNYPWA